MPTEEAEAFSISGIEVVQDKWWRSFEDETLNELVTESLENNLLIAANYQEFLVAMANYKGESSFLWPEIAAVSSVEKTSSTERENRSYQAGFSASYELDLWGRVRAGVKAEKMRTTAAFFDYRSAAMTISAETAVTWYAYLTTLKQLELLQEQIKINRDILNLIEARFASGQIRAVDILRQERLLESTKEQQVVFKTRLALLENQLAVLLGIPPQNLVDLPVGDLPELPELPDPGLPLELIRRRPDVLSAHYLVLAADRELAQALRSRYPVISVEALGQYSAQNFSSLFQNWAYSLAGNVVAPLIYGGRIKAEIKRTSANKRRLIYEYGQTVLNAFQEVEDALIREKLQKEKIEAIETQLVLLKKTNAQLKMEFLNGLSDYLDVLISLDEEQQLQRDLLEANQELLEIRISLYRALAGGFKIDGLEKQTELYNIVENE